MNHMIFAQFGAGMTLDFSRVTLPPLWTVDQAKVHLRISGTAHDADIAQKLATAQEAILSYLGPGADPTWSAGAAPAAVTHAIHLLTAYVLSLSQPAK